jgi:hypothetical protein
MDTNNGLHRIETEDLDDEIFYREQLGCQLKVDETGGCATMNCPDGELKVCQKPGIGNKRQLAEDISDYDYEAC